MFPLCVSLTHCSWVLLQLYVTQDFGKSATFIGDFVFGYQWGQDDETIFYTRVRDGQGHMGHYQAYEPSLFVSTDLGKGFLAMYPHVPAFAYEDQILFAGMVCCRRDSVACMARIVSPAGSAFRAH